MTVVVPPKLHSGEWGVLIADTLDSSLCGEIIMLSEAPDCPQVSGKIQAFNSDTVVTDLQTRRVDTWVIHENHIWVDDLICAAARAANEDFDFDLCGIIERPQLLRYKAPHGHYAWHTDIGRGDSSTRKISVVIPLNEDYVGGELAFFQSGEEIFDIPAGSMVCFPSFLPHAVMPVTSGVRWSLAAWVSGSAFR